MRALKATLGLYFVSSVGLLLTGSAAFACGDKFLLASRGVKGMRGTATAHPASVLIYMSPGSTVSTANPQMRFEATLTLAGNKATTVGGPEQLRQALKSGKFDLVLSDIGDAPAVKQDIATASSTALIVPMLSPSEKAGFKSAQKEYGSAVASPGKPSDVVTAVDDAMALKLKEKAARTNQ